MNAIEFLISEHEKVRTMLTDISSNSRDYETQKHLFDSLCDDLLRHEVMEHKIWYPYFKDDKRLSETVRHLLTEEKGAEKAIKQLDDIDEQHIWEKKFTKFKEQVEHHAREEERDLFPQVQNLLSEDQLEKIGKEMAQFKRDYTKH